MKVYEVMNELAKMPAGAKIRINMVKSLRSNKDRVVEFEVREVSADGNYVNIDGWTE